MMRSTVNGQHVADIDEMALRAHIGGLEQDAGHDRGRPEARAAHELARFLSVRMKFCGWLRGEGEAAEYKLGPTARAQRIERLRAAVDAVAADAEDFTPEAVEAAL